MPGIREYMQGDSGTLSSKKVIPVLVGHSGGRQGFSVDGCDLLDSQCRLQTHESGDV